MVKLLEMGALNSLGTGSTATFLAAINVIMLNNSSLTAPCKKWARSHKFFFSTRHRASWPSNYYSLHAAI